MKWRTLVVLQDEKHLGRIKEIGREMNVPPSRIMGKLLDTFIKKYEAKHG